MKVVPLHASQWRFSVSDENYKDKGLKCSEIDVGVVWVKELSGAGSQEASLMKLLRVVTVATEEIVDSLGSTEIHSIRHALLNRRTLNWVFDLLGVKYPDWPYRTPCPMRPMPERERSVYPRRGKRLRSLRWLLGG